MCTSPIEITRRLPSGSVRSYTVPCGKCEECRASYQSEFAARCAVEASARGSLHFITFTYNNSWLPVNFIDYVPELKDFVPTAFQRGDSCYDWQLKEWSTFGCSVQTNDDSTSVCPTLHRDDIKHLLKKFRIYCKRKDIPLDFGFTVFGEYGEEKSRPHYHALFAGLSDSQANILCNMWTYGFSDVKSIPRFNKDGSDAFVLTSNYVSKYIAKRDRLPDFVKYGFAESPRRQSSVGFGLSGVDFDKMRPFLFGGRLCTSSVK